MLWTPLLALALGLSLPGGKHSGPSVPSASEIAFIETRIQLPVDAPAPFVNYERYYAWTVGDDGKKLIYGELIFVDLLGSGRPSDRIGRPHAVTEQEIPTMANGGCGVITFYFDPRSDKDPSLYCNAVTPSDSQ